MVIYRISSSKYIADLSGTGAKQYGGRWNEKGIAMVYFAETRAMAVMEVLTHLRPEELDREFSLAAFEVPADKVTAVLYKDLPADWKTGQDSGFFKKLGAKFIAENKYLLMKVPSVILEEEFNYLLNPNHIDAEKIKMIDCRAFVFDKRLKN